MNENGTPAPGVRGEMARDSGDGVLRIDRMGCLNPRARHIVCTQCADACPARALEVTADEVRLDAGRCTACGACLPVCPSGALRLRGFDPRYFLQTLAGAAEVHIHCSRSAGAHGGHVVPCLRILDTRLLAAAAAGGARTVVLHGTIHCASCDRGDARAAVERMRAELQRWLADGTLHLVQESGAHAGRHARAGAERTRSPGLSRRSFLRLDGMRAAPGAAKRLADAVREPDDMAQRWPVSTGEGRSGRRSAYQELLAERAASLAWRDQDLPWRSRVFSEACRACLVCTRLCPTGALVARQTGSAISIWFDLRRCTDCGLCQRLCPEGAISCASVAGSQELRAPPRRVVHRSLRRCARCARGFVPGPASGELCTTCQNEHDVESAWKAMLIESSKARVPPHEAPGS